MPHSVQTLLGFAAILLVPLIGIGLFVYLIFFDAPTEEVSEGVIATQFLQYQATAERYRSRLLDYAGMCDDIGLPAGTVCQATETDYRISQPLPNGTYYCMDTTGFKGTTPTRPQGITCP
jgi:hypothetical protein